MKKKKIIIIGGVAAGMTVASNINRKSKSNIDMVVYEQRSYASFGACGIPFFLADSNLDPSVLLSPSVERHLENGINLKVNHQVIAINLKEKKLFVRNLKTQQNFEDTFDQIVISTGASPIKPSWFQSYEDKMFTATTFEDTLKLKKKIDSSNVKKVIIVGGGFIGLELAEAFTQKGKKVILLEREKNILNNVINPKMALIFQEHLKKHLDLHCNVQINKVILNSKKELEIQTLNKEKYTGDLVVVCTGFKPNTQLFHNQLEMTQRGSIVINELGQTSLKNVFAAGDCATINSKIDNQKLFLPFATSARKMAKIIALQIMGKSTKFPGTLGSSGVSFEGLEFLTSGYTKFTNLNQGHQSVIVESKDTPEYAPNPQKIILKLIANRQGILVGTQILGFNKSAAIRMAALCTAIWNKMHVADLANLDLFYFPRFTRATDILHIAANQLAKKIK